MKVKDFFPLIFVFIGAVICCVVHEFLLHLTALDHGSDDFYRPLQMSYLFFTICTVVIYVILIFVRNNAIDNVGMMFMLLTCLKIGVAGVYIYPATQANLQTLPKEKINFFIIFALFLTAETVLSARLLRGR